MTDKLLLTIAVISMSVIELYALYKGVNGIALATFMGGLSAIITAKSIKVFGRKDNKVE